jgi:hypothetical protein
MTTQSGSLTNMLMANQKAPPSPTIGMGATILRYTDRAPATVVWVSPSGKTLHLQEDDAARVDANGMSECQTYTFTPNPAATVQVAHLTTKGWKIVKGSRIRLGDRDKYHDFSF